ncbi:hypothetical protein DJ568_11265 [Mucilaginibacter hurinus]|uniref:DinB-like domain-containing protein n=1 Tax=Mucilaginibacter hurinus TaxID=2201324 RepID=A0A367GNH8_9SPHI|nr:DinB family protein [Mucilaginibacter hurinus]RCH55042.1 hypothetical protein DJ568_11265 [Mucilaginibacter hurinus]
MIKSEKLAAELRTVLSGNAWYGTPVYEMLDTIPFDIAYLRPPGGAHSIAEITMHMLNWTEEAISRMQGNKAGMPENGNWPNAGAADEQRWSKLLTRYKLINAEFGRVIQAFPDGNWDALTNDDRDEPSTGGNYEELVHGLIQHHVYHAGQIGIIKRMLNGSQV